MNEDWKHVDAAVHIVISATYLEVSFGKKTQTKKESLHI